MLERTITASVYTTPWELASEFANLDEMGKVEFFNELARLVEKRDITFCFHLQAVTDNPLLTNKARDVMRAIGEYAEPD